MDRTETFAGSGSDASDDSPPPATLGRYSLRGRIGRGGFADVYRAWDAQLERWLAVKVPRRDRADDREAVEAWLAEARAMARVDHPHVVPIFDVGSEGDEFTYIVCKFVEGIDLKRLLLERRFDWREAVRLCTTVADALAHIHEKGLVHRDVKPGNILVASDGHVWLTDFGLALWEDRVGDRAYAYAGTLGYMSPEQARGEGHLVDGRTDVFSLGVVLYRTVTGKMPFSGQTDRQFLTNLASRDPSPLRQWNPQVPQALERVCLKALSKRASDRYSSASEFRDELLASLKDENEDEVSGDTDRSTRAAKSEPNIPVRPRGLRPYQEADREFFLRLIEGPRDRDGTPQSVLDWITAVAGDTLESPFPICVAYGPSGSGKTSLFRAGIVPSLPSSVTALLADSSTERLSATLVRRLRQLFPDSTLPDDLAGALKSLRLQSAARSLDDKLLLVLDQFEQRLQSDDAERVSLFNALRQCDGQHVQAILVVRDDFWMPLSRFLHDLDVRLEEGANAFAVDLFSIRHAQRVLEELGRAYGSLPAAPTPLNAGQARCVEEIVATVQERDRVIPIRLAIVAQMLRGKTWEAGAIGRIGGAEGVVGAFLERAFEPPDAPPGRRRLAPAARRVLAELLPAEDSAIKDRAKAEATLRARADLPAEDFDELMRTLEKDLRILTLASEESEESAISVSIESPRRYRLTHDYLIRPLRNWLNRKRRETFHGRTKIRLEELASLWSWHPEARFLPTAGEFVAMELLVPRDERNEHERRLLEVTRARLRRVALRWGSGVALLLAMAFVAYRFAEERRLAFETQDLVDRLVTVQTDNVPAILEELDGRGERARPLLEALADDPTQSESSRTRASAALLPFDGKYGETIARALATTESLSDFALLRDQWRRADAETARTLTALSWTSELGAPARLRASAALLANPPEPLDWSERSEGIAKALVEAPPHELPFWIETFRPLRQTLRPETERLFSIAREGEEKRNAAAAIAAWADDDPQSVVRAVLESDASSFEVLFPALKRLRPQAIASLIEEASKSSSTATPPQVQIPSDIDQEIAAAEGLAGPGFVLCQSLPRDRFAEFASQLDALGYRPAVLRPWTSDEGARIAAIWKHEKGERRFRESMTREEALAEDRRARAVGLIAYDLAAEESSDGRRWTLLWGSPSDGVETSELYLDVSEQDHSEHWQPLNDSEFVPKTGLLAEMDGDRRYSSIRWKVDRVVAYADRWKTSASEMVACDLAGWPVVDIRIYDGDEPEYGAIWWDGLAADSELVSGADLHEHLEACKAAAKAGYIPVSLCAAGGARSRAASVWHKRHPAPADLDVQAARRANAAVAAIGLGAFDEVRSSLFVGDDNRVRTEIVVRLGAFGIDPSLLVALLDKERNASVRSGLLLALAGFEPDAMPTKVQDRVVALASEDAGRPSAQVRSAALCLLRRWGRRSEADQASENPPRQDASRTDADWYRGPAGLDFVVVPGPSSFRMGSTGDDLDRSPHWETIHVRQVPRTFAIATTEVTVAQYRLFDPEYRAPAAYAADEACPATTTSLYDAAGFCRWLSEQAGIAEEQMCYPPLDQIGPGMTLPDDFLKRTGYRLPTEAEWELACRAGSTTSRHYGSRATLLPLFGWNADSSDYRSHPVGQLMPNELGLFDMYGNAMERTHSAWAPYPRSISDPIVDRLDNETIQTTDVFVVRGGAFLHAPSNGRSAQRHRNSAASEYPDLGFRVVRTMPAPAS